MYEDKVAAYKQEYHAINVAEMALGAPVKADPTGALWFCPFHDDQGTPNFHVTSEKDHRYPDHFKCFTGHCKFNRGGDIFDFLKELNDSNYTEAMDYIDNGRLRDSDVPIVLKTASPAQRAKEYVIAPSSTLEMAEQYHANLDETHRVYYWTRGLSDETIDRFLLGYDLATHRYVTPYRNTVGVYDFKRRRDDWWVEEDLKAKGTAWMQNQMEIIWAKRVENAGDAEPRLPTEKDVIKANYPKYIWGKAGSGVRWLFNEDRLIRGKGYWLPYLFLTADEMSVLSLEQAGYPAVCWSGDAAFPAASDKIKYAFHGKVIDVTIRDIFKPAMSVYIVADGDRSGIFAAKKRRASLGRGEIVQVPVSDGIKDPADWLARGFKVEDWLSHIPPILNE